MNAVLNRFNGFLSTIQIHSKESKPLKRLCNPGKYHTHG